MERMALIDSHVSPNVVHLGQVDALRVDFFAGQDRHGRLLAQRLFGHFELFMAVRIRCQVFLVLSVAVGTVFTLLTLTGLLGLLLGRCQLVVLVFATIMLAFETLVGIHI